MPLSVLLLLILPILAILGSPSPFKFPLEVPLWEQHQRSGLPGCEARHFGESFVCLCNGTHCDQPEPVGQLSPGKAVLFLSEPVQLRLNRSELAMGRGKGEDAKGAEAEEVHIRVDASRQFQSVLGFGGAFTDAAGYNMKMLSEKALQNLLRAYFDKNTGIGYTLGRVPMASCDFSTRVYSYCDTPGDFELKTFKLAQEDLVMKIPYIQEAWKLSESGLKLFASPWSAPAWMKTTGKMQGGGSLRGTLNGPYYRTYANYFRRFFEEYSSQGNLTFWGLTIENEPSGGLHLDYSFQAMWVSPRMQRDFANQLLAPLLKQSPITENIRIMAHDDGLDTIHDTAIQVFNKSAGEENASNSVAGLAYHWYADFANPNKSVLDQLHQLFPEPFFLATEACTGWNGPSSDRGPSLGNWTRAEMYARDILRGLNSWAVGWTDWNLCLDQRGGPNWVYNYVDSPIIVNSTSDEFYKQPMFYAMAHFSRFVPAGSVRIHSQLVANSRAGHNSQPAVEFVAFRSSAGGTGDRVLVLISNVERPVDVLVEEGPDTARLTLPPRALATLIWPKGR